MIFCFWPLQLAANFEKEEIIWIFLVLSVQYKEDREGLINKQENSKRNWISRLLSIFRTNLIFKKKLLITIVFLFSLALIQYLPLCILYWRLKVKRSNHKEPRLYILEPIHSNLSYLYCGKYSSLLHSIHPVRFFGSVALFCLARVYRMCAHIHVVYMYVYWNHCPKFPGLIVFYYVYLCVCTHIYVLYIPLLAFFSLSVYKRSDLLFLFNIELFINVSSGARNISK